MDMEEIRNYTGFCPQFNIYFDFSYREREPQAVCWNKRIPAKEVEQEVDAQIRTDDLGNNLLSFASGHILLFHYYFTLS